MKFNDREPAVAGGAVAPKRKAHVLEQFPESGLEAIVVQWEGFRPTVLIQLCRDLREPVQFPGLRPQMPGNLDLPRDRASVLDQALVDFVDAATGKPFDREAFLADLVFSQRAFAILQPEPDLVMPIEQLWECRTEALTAIGVADEVGLKKVSGT